MTLEKIFTEVFYKPRISEFKEKTSLLMEFMHCNPITKNISFFK